MTAPGEGREDDLAAAILDLLDERGPAKTICPSEAARRVDPEGWRDAMEPAREAARELAVEGRIEIVRGGEPLDPQEPFGGPVRLRLTPP